MIEEGGEERGKCQNQTKESSNTKTLLSRSFYFHSAYDSSSARTSPISATPTTRFLDLSKPERDQISSISYHPITPQKSPHSWSHFWNLIHSRRL